MHYFYFLIFLEWQEIFLVFWSFKVLFGEDN